MANAKQRYAWRYLVWCGCPFTVKRSANGHSVEIQHDKKCDRLLAAFNGAEIPPLAEQENPNG